ncbi:hypothetical protein F511_05142 [Dorcoceras hygrometricum]|uniref:CCHC-type domain-containing protein n=1 Tax=Dorcoceras hygrometricum TaxID=472368 RepID=A0A2Z7C2F4_9LAMI|nr:hypothetical protein F511_05142 [Dorcoceras hygrometricum]
MKSFLIGRKLWRIVTGDITTPTKQQDETDDRFADRLEDWDSKNHQIITWFRNTSIPSIHIQFADYNTAKEIWDFLSNRYKTTGLAHYFQLWTTLHNLKQESGQSVNDFLAQVQPIWNQISQAKISEDHLHLIQVLMALRPEYEDVRASLLHRHPLPTLDMSVQEIIFEETRLNLDKTLNSEIALATTRASYQKSGKNACKNCNQTNHVFAHCPTIECRYCHATGHILENCPIRPPRPKNGAFKPKTISTPGSTAVSADTTEGFIPTEGPTVITMSDLEALLK